MSGGGSKGGRSGRSGRGRGGNVEGKAANRRREQDDRDTRSRERVIAGLSDQAADGLVLCMYGSHADIAFADDTVGFCLLSPKVHKLFGLAVGDRVWSSPASCADDRIVLARTERRTELRRKRSEEDRTGHVIAANVDQIAITVSLHEPPLRTGALDRYLLLASVLGLTPLIVLTKTDQAPEEDPGWAVLAPYRSLGVPVLPTSAASGAGLDALRDVLRGKVTVFAGHSGVGKSSLCIALGLENSPVAGEMSRSGGRVRGRHTTSIARLLELPRGGWVVDTPGVRSIGLVDLEKEDLAVHFNDLAQLAVGCEFSDCLHVDEEGCAVAEAVAAGELGGARWDGYRRLLASLQAEE